MASPIQPTRCISSRLTTSLLCFRNPQKEEQHWLLQSHVGLESRGNLLVFSGKVIVTEIGATLLCLTALVESAAYAVFTVISIPLILISREPFKASFQLLSSSGFTLIWNFGNITVFNLFNINVVTHESFARFSIDYWPRGSIFKLVMLISRVALALFIGNQPLMETNPFPEHFMRTEDMLYITMWSHNHHVQFDQRSTAVNNPIANQLSQTTRTSRQAIEVGTAFFQKYILADNQIAEATRDLVLYVDADVIHFTITRCIYEYVLGAEKNNPTAPFCTEEAQQYIDQLRQKYKDTPAPNFKKELFNHQDFDGKTLSEQDFPIFNDLKITAGRLLRDSLFLQSWQIALQHQ